MILKILTPFVILSLVGCANTQPPSDASVQARQERAEQKRIKKAKRAGKEVIVVRAPAKTITVKCSLPRQPGPLTRPLPFDSPKKLVDRLTAKLQEWVRYGDRVEASCK